MEIDSVGKLQVNGSTRKVQYVTNGDGISIEFGGQVIFDVIRILKIK
ncbi:MAG: hypothetical protein ACOCUV_02815 [bacterium]